MKQQRMTSLVAGVALLLGCAPLTVIYRGLFDWMIPVAFTTALIIGASVGARALRWNAVLQTLAMFAALLLSCTWQYSNGGALLGLLPGPGTFKNFGVLMGQAGEDIQKQLIPVESTQALVFLLVVGIGALAILTEVFVSVMRIPALVGIPLLLLYLIPMPLLKQEIPWLLFVPGALGFLWLLMTDNIDRVRRYGRRFSGDGRGIDRWEPSPLAGTGRWLAGLVVLAALVLPLMVPGVNSNLLAGIGTGGGPGIGGDGSTLAPWANLEGSLNKTSGAVVGYVKTNQKSDTGYLKMYALSELTEDGFSDKVSPSSLSYPAEEGLRTDHTEEVESDEYRAEVRLTGLDNNALPMFSYATNVDLDRDVSDEWDFDPVSDTVTSKDATSKGMSYAFDYTRYQYTDKALRTAPDVSENSEAYRLNTDRPAIKSVKKLTKERIAGKETQFDKVRSIFSYFSSKNGFKYELQTKADNSASDIENFLKYREGYCQQYAAAMGWMVREAGIPARVALGITPGAKTSKGYELNTDNFHAWVEVYYEGFGWVPYDPTPASGVAGSQDSDWAPDPNKPDESDSGDEGNNNENGGDNEQGGNNEQNPNQRPDGSGNTYKPPPLAARLPAPTWPYWLAGAALASLAVITPGVVRSLRRNRRLSLPDSRPEAAAESAWRELCDSLTDLRIRFDESETARSLANRLIGEYQLDGAAAAGLRHLAAAQEHSRYAPAPPTGLTLRKAVRAARFGLAARQSRFAQLRADLAPASLLSSWAWGLRDASSSVGNARTRGARALGRLIPRRRSTVTR
ncbi:transglutaminase TgpA family protein [Stackebrandtia nassauensis]|uniref:Transglutaminase domain protein n=1 Tax=Stackebrandtia nassauensis (strain DSM 44728 / CIP 108903 / NRRL B-16338 / NBRC 102104 / LLR-40K-21) TaxID=446470 RepID=D3Q9L2_STANL|nr:DUF3488 and transglutaminase-like domain-containing protein [Stackebrandtia nassauensis]ADD44558.1 transglutaminase domain protein [Stackebrandtia nassauensis DSM 44728]